MKKHPKSKVTKLLKDKMMQVLQVFIFVTILYIYIYILQKENWSELHFACYYDLSEELENQLRALASFINQDQTVSLCVCYTIFGALHMLF